MRHVSRKNGIAFAKQSVDRIRHPRASRISRVIERTGVAMLQNHQLAVPSLWHKMISRVFLACFHPDRQRVDTRGILQILHRTGRILLNRSRFCARKPCVAPDVADDLLPASVSPSPCSS